MTTASIPPFGGFTVTVNSERLDASVANQLKQLGCSSLVDFFGIYILLIKQKAHPLK